MTSYEVTQPQNGESASITGLELAVQNQLNFLPAPFDGLGVYANYTYTTSSAHLPDRSDKQRLPGQVRHSGNIAGWYEKGGFSTRLALNFRGSFLSEVGGDAAEDLFVDQQYQLDLSLNHAITRSVRLFGDVLNLTNEPLRVYENVVDRPIQEESLSLVCELRCEVDLLSARSRWTRAANVVISLLLSLASSGCGNAASTTGDAAIALSPLQPTRETAAVASRPRRPRDLGVFRGSGKEPHSRH